MDAIESKSDGIYYAYRGDIDAEIVAFDQAWVQLHDTETLQSVNNRLKELLDMAPPRGGRIYSTLEDNSAIVAAQKLAYCLMSKLEQLGKTEGRYCWSLPTPADEAFCEECRRTFNLVNRLVNWFERPISGVVRQHMVLANQLNLLTACETAACAMFGSLSDEYLRIADKVDSQFDYLMTVKKERSKSRLQLKQLLPAVKKDLAFISRCTEAAYKGARQLVATDGNAEFTAIIGLGSNRAGKLRYLACSVSLEATGSTADATKSMLEISHMQVMAKQLIATRDLPHCIQDGLREKRVDDHDSRGIVYEDCERLVQWRQGRNVQHMCVNARVCLKVLDESQLPNAEGVIVRGGEQVKINFKMIELDVSGQ
jgi:hypothetical protein